MDDDHSAHDPAADVRRITSAKEMRALAHPLRWKLLEVLDLETQATAAQCARILGESHSLCSFHLHQLAKYALVEQVPTTSRRDRPWRLTRKNLSFPVEVTEESERTAIRSVRSVIVSREMDLLQTWIERQFEYSEEWREASMISNSRIWLTPDELREVREALLDVIVKVERSKTHSKIRDADARPVRVLIAGFPMEYSEPKGEPDAPAPNDARGCGGSADHLPHPHAVLTAGQPGPRSFTGRTPGSASRIEMRRTSVPQRPAR